MTLLLAILCALNFVLFIRSEYKSKASGGTFVFTFMAFLTLLIEPLKGM